MPYEIAIFQYQLLFVYTSYISQNISNIFWCQTFPFRVWSIYPTALICPRVLWTEPPRPWSLLKEEIRASWRHLMGSSSAQARVRENVATSNSFFHALHVSNSHVSNLSGVSRSGLRAHVAKGNTCLHWQGGYLQERRRKVQRSKIGLLNWCCCVVLRRGFVGFAVLWFGWSCGQVGLCG